jgi:hypothetical protein
MKEIQRVDENLDNEPQKSKTWKTKKNHMHQKNKLLLTIRRCKNPDRRFVSAQTSRPIV